MSAKRRSKLPKMSMEPQNINKENWYYEGGRGLTLVHQVTEGDRLLRTDQVVIPWRLLNATFARRSAVVKLHQSNTPRAIRARNRARRAAITAARGNGGSR